MADTLNLLTGQVAIVTGGAQGIGLAIAERFVASGAAVMIADVGEEQAQASARNLGASDRVAAQRCDVTKMADNEALVKACIERFGRLDILVNNAGITRDSYIAKMSEADFDAVVGVSLKGAWLGTRAVATLFREQRSGCIVNMSSLSGKIGNPGQTNYSSAKAGLIGLTKASAKELGPSNVRVNAVMPGLIKTAMTLAMKPEVWASKEREVPMQRAGTPEEVANVCLFLASPLSSYVNGAVIEVTGGRGI